MERRQGDKDSFFDAGEPLRGTRGFGNFGSTRGMMMPSLFGGRDPFDDPFFTRPFGSMFQSSMFGPSVGPDVTKETKAVKKGIVIEELDSDDEREEKEGEGHGDKIPNEPLIEHPDDCAEMKNKTQHSSMDYNRVQGTQNQTHKLGVQTCRVTYGGVDGAYYTSTRTRKSGGNGVILEESKEADITAGEATHRISRGIHDKGHSVTRKLNSDAKVDTLQALHNLNEDELACFEKAWNGNIKGHMPVGWDGVHDMHGYAGNGSHAQIRKSSWDDRSLATSEHTQGNRFETHNVGGDFSSGRTKKVVRINIE